MKPYLWPLTAIFMLALAGCSQESSKNEEPKSDATPAPAAIDPEAARIAENARLDAIHSDCMKRPPAASAQAMPLVDGLYKKVPQEKTYSSTWWLAKSQTALLAEPRAGAAETAKLPPQTWAEVMEDVAFTAPARGIVLEPGQGFDLKLCDIVYQIDKEDGEGASTEWVWHQGRVFTLDSDDGDAGADALRARPISHGVGRKTKRPSPPPPPRGWEHGCASKRRTAQAAVRATARPISTALGRTTATSTTNRPNARTIQAHRRSLSSLSSSSDNIALRNPNYPPLAGGSKNCIGNFSGRGNAESRMALIITRARSRAGIAGPRAFYAALSSATTPQAGSDGTLRKSPARDSTLP